MDLILIVAAIALVAVIALLASAQLRSTSLKRRFGAEYDRAVESEGDRRSAESLLRERAKRRAALDIRDLAPETRARYHEQMKDAQWGFVDDPVNAVAEAGALVQEAMRERGYPIDGFEARVEMLSVDFPALTEKYRWAYAVQYQSDEGLTTNLDELRRAFQYHRTVLDEVVGDGSPVVARAEEPEPEALEESNR